MADGADVSGIRDRVTKLEFETSQMPSKEFVQNAMDNALRAAAERDRERNEALVKVFDERLGANRSAILTDIARDHQEFREEVRVMLKEVVKEEVPGAVRAEVRAIKAEEELAKQKKISAEKEEADEREKKWLKIKNRFYLGAAAFSLATSAVVFFYSLQGEASPSEVRALDRIDGGLNSFVQ